MIADYRTQLAAFVRDEVARLTSGDVDRAIAVAVTRYGKDRPRPAVEDVADNAHFQKLADLTVVRGADEPLARLQAHLRATPHRVLLLAESDGRRESLLDFLRASGVSPPAFDSLAE